MTAAGKSDGGAVQLAGIIPRPQGQAGPRGRAACSFIRISDQTAVFETTVFSELLTANDDLLRPGAAVVFHGHHRLEEETARPAPGWRQSLDDAAKAASAGLRITADAAKATLPLRSVLESRKAKAASASR